MGVVATPYMALEMEKIRQAILLFEQQGNKIFIINGTVATEKLRLTTEYYSCCKFKCIPLSECKIKWQNKVL